MFQWYKFSLLFISHCYYHCEQFLINLETRKQLFQAIVSFESMTKADAMFCCLSLCVYACTVYVCICEYAGSSFEVKTEADSSDITQSPQDDKSRPYLCTVCHKRFATKCGVKVHSKRHKGENVYSCPQCGKKCSSQSNLRGHVYIHTGKYKCTECGRCCKSSTELAVHRRSHSGEKPFECTVCSKGFATLRELVLHNRIHSGEKPYKCHVCEKAFSQSSALHTHMRVHTGDKPYKCSLCNKCFSQSSGLQLHKRHVHSNRRPYLCPYCGKLFKTNGDLKQHVRIHKAVPM